MSISTTNKILSGNNISKTYENVIHTNCINLYDVYNVPSFIFNTFTGKGMLIPFSYQYTESLHNIDKNSAFTSCKTTTYFETISTNTLTLNCYKDVSIQTNISNIKNNITVSGALSSTQFYTTAILSLNHLLSDNVFTLAKLPSSLSTNTHNTYNIGNVKYVREVPDACITAIKNTISSNYFKNKDKLVWAYANNQKSLPYFTVNIQESDLINNSIQIVVLGSVSVSISADKLNCKFQVYVDGNPYGSTYTVGAYVNDSSSHDTDAYGNQVLAFIEPIELSSTGPHTISFKLSEGVIQQCSMAVLNGKQFTKW